MTTLSGVVSHVGMLDLTWAKTEEDLKNITAIEHVGVVRVPKHLYNYVCSIPMKHVGMVEQMEGGPKKELTGQVRLTGDFLARGDPDTTLVLTGQIIVTPPVAEVGFREIRITGQLVLPRGCEAEVSAKLGNVVGQVIYCSFDKGMPRFFMSERESVGREFLELLPEAVPWVIVSDLTIEDDVTVDLLRAKVPEIVLVGKLIAPKALIPTLQVLATEKVGAIMTPEEAARAPKHGPTPPPAPFAVGDEGK